MRKILKFVAGKRGDGRKHFFTRWANDLSVFEVESMYLNSGARFVIENGKIVDME